MPPLRRRLISPKGVLARTKTLIREKRALILRDSFISLPILLSRAESGAENDHIYQQLGGGSVVRWGRVFRAKIGKISKLYVAHFNP